MDAYNDISPLWDLSQASSFSQLPDDDFLALLQKQFPSAGVPPTYTTGVSSSLDPRFSLSSSTPPSDESSPSPPHEQGNHDEGGDSALKRKASTDDFEEGPSQKSQHTCACIHPLYSLDNSCAHSSRSKQQQKISYEHLFSSQVIGVCSSMHILWG